jgi:Tfp pilus assembly protein PilN
VLQRGGIAAGVVVLLLGVLYVHGRSVVHSKQNRLAATKAQLAVVQAKVAKVEATQKLARARFTVVQSIATSRMNWDGTLLDLARVIPSGVYLQSLSATAATKSAVSVTASASTFTVAGSAPSYVGTASVLDRLSLLPWLSDIALQTSARQADGSVTFSIQATVVPGGQR